MPSILSALNIGTKSLLASQTAMGTISHNISNTNTEGYTRQRVIAESQSSIGFGAGVRITEIQRVVNERLELKISEQLGVHGFNNTRYKFMKDLEAIFGSPNSGNSMDKLLNTLFEEMNVLSGATNSSSQQLNVVQNMLFVTDTLNTISADIQSLQTDLDEEIDNEIVAVNSAIQKIQELNEEIAEIIIAGATQGGNPNDLIDARQKQVNILAERLSITTAVDPDGRMRIVTDSGRRLVDSSYTQLERIPASPFADIGITAVLSDGSLSSTSFPILLDRMSAGSLKAIVDVRDNFLEDLSDQVDELAAVMIKEINLIHSQGTGVPPQTSFITGNGVNISAAGADLSLATELGLTLGSSFDISLVDIANGQPISTTQAAGGGTLSIAIPAVGPVTLADIANLINTNPDVGGAGSGTVTASVTTDANGNPALQVVSNTAGEAIVFGNTSGNPLGELGINNLLTGETAADVSVRTDIQSDPALFATARMRASDGGLSFHDNQNIIELSQLADTELSFAAVGNLGAQTDSITGYFITLVSNYAVSLDDSNNRAEFSETILLDLRERLSEVAGVNQDEELSNLIIYQNAFQASAKIISVMDEMLETIVNMV